MVMGFNPLEEKGIPMEQQTRDWGELNVQTYDKNEVHPYTRTRVILMNGIEVEAALFGHQFARHTDDMYLRRQLAQVRRIEQQQQKAVNWLIPGNESTLEVTIGYEQLAVDLTANLAKNESDSYVKQCLDFALLEDFDHLYRYANLLDMIDGKRASDIVGQLTEITPGRPTVEEHRHPGDDIRRPTDSEIGDLLTQLHIMTIVAAEQQTMNYYMNVGNRLEDHTGRGLYLEIAQVEEEHVTHYESLLDPRLSWLEMLVMHEYHECWMYYSLMQHEPDQRIRKIWETHLSMEIEHLKSANELLKQYENKDARDYLPRDMPTLLKIESNIEYVRDILSKQVDLTTKDEDFVMVDQLPGSHRYFKYQEKVNINGDAPSIKVIREHIDRFGEDYRLEVKGPHPVERLRTREKVLT
jgi:rubrerythrin